MGAYLISIGKGEFIVCVVPGPHKLQLGFEIFWPTIIRYIVWPVILDIGEFHLAAESNWDEENSLLLFSCYEMLVKKNFKRIWREWWWLLSKDLDHDHRTAVHHISSVQNHKKGFLLQQIKATVTFIIDSSWTSRLCLFTINVESESCFRYIHTPWLVWCTFQIYKHAMVGAVHSISKPDIYRG